MAVLGPPPEGFAPQGGQAEGLPLRLGRPDEEPDDRANKGQTCTTRVPFVPLPKVSGDRRTTPVEFLFCSHDHLISVGV